MPTPMTVEFEELMATKHTTPTEDLLFSLPVIAVSEIENSLDSTPLSVRELDESVVQDHQSKQAQLISENMQEPDDLELEDEPVVVYDQSVQVSETLKDIQEPDDNVVREQPEEDTVTEVREELVR